MDKNFKVLFGDIILVSVPRDEICYPNSKQIGKGIIKEYAILSKDHKHFVLVAEFEKGTVRKSDDHLLHDGTTDRFVLIRPKTTTILKAQVQHDWYTRYNLFVTLKEKKISAISFKRLQKQNNYLIKSQLKKLIKKQNNSLQKDREKYQCVFEK